MVFIKTFPNTWKTIENIRLAAIMSSVYEILIAHVMMFVMLLGLINAEKAQKLLMEDIEDQKEMEDYYYYPPANSRGDTIDILRLNCATKLAASTVFKLTIGAVYATIYLLVCMGLFLGVVKNREKLIFTWMAFDMIVLIVNTVALLYIFDLQWFEDITSCTKYGFILTYLSFEFAKWTVVAIYYKIVSRMSMLREEAVIKCPTLIVSPSPYPVPEKKEIENFVKGEQGELRHTLFEPEQGDYPA